MLSAPDASSGGIQFTAPLQNDFQWRNLYMKQYGTCTYPPPIPKNPSTTSNAFPKRKDIGTYLGDIDSDGEEDYTTVETVHRKSLSRKESFFNLADNFVNDEAGGGAQGDGDSHHRHGDDGKNSNQDDSELESFLFAPNIFNFLYKKKPKAPVPGSNFSDISSDVADPTLPAEGSIGSLAVGSHLINPHHIPREIFKLHRDAWSLLMDNRAMAWLEREASEKGHTATNVRRRLLEVAVGPNSMLAKNWEKINAEDFQAVRSPPISEEASFQRVYESFVPFFAVISSPSIVRRLKDQFMASRRVQTRGMAGAAADIVGYPLFSQFSTWKEAYQHRKLWNCTPLSFFLIHDASFNYAHISAVYVLLGVINDHSHIHSHKCIGNKSGPILLEEASRLLLHSREIRKAVEMQRYLCPLLAVQQVTEDILLAFEQSASRTTLSMVLNVCGFLTDCVLDPETATRFLGREALVRQSSFHVPGMNVMKTEDVAAPAATKPEGEDAEEGEGDATTDQLPNSPDDQGIQAFGLKQFSDADFDALFDLVFWFIDAPTANSRVPVDTALIPPPREHHSPHADQPDQLQPTGSMETTTSPRKRSNSPAFGRGKLKRSNSISMSGTQNQAQNNNNNNNNANNNSGATEHQYIPGRLQVFSPVRSIVEAVTLHEVCRGALMQVKQRSSTKDASRAKKASRGGTRNMSMEIPSRDNTRDDLSESVSSIKEPSLSLSTTLLATPLIFISSYIRLHGGPWLKHLFNRLFNILRRESVLLYVNRLDLGEPRHIMDPTPHIPAGSTPTTTPTKRSNSPHLRPSPSTLSPSRGGLESESSHAFIGRMERLEDLICQDIQFLMNEFFSALHGKRSLTRLPQGITSLITQFTSTVHLHLLNSITMATVDNTDRPGNTAKRVRDSIGALKQKRMAGKAFRADHITDSSVSRLICNIEQYRMTKFLLFDTWIIPALNDAVSCGYLSESSSLHLRWNIDAFARYLKILVNSPFADADSSSRANVPKTMIQSPASRRKKSSSSNLRDTMQPPFTLTLPRYITGIYDVSSGSLVRVFSPQGPSTPPPLATPPDEASVPASPVYHHVNEMSLPTLMPQTRTFGSLRAPQWKPTPPSRSPAGLSQSLQLETSVSVFNTVNRSSYFKVMDEAGWEDISASMRGLNEGLGIAGYDPDEEADIYRMDRGIGAYSEENCAMRVLDIFCRRASYEGSTNVVVSEFEVLPSMAAGCIDKIYDMMTGAHPLVSQSLGSGALPNKFSFSPYLACLNGVLLHPKSAARALDNIYYNSQRFYNTLMQPVRDESILNMLSALVVDQDDLPMVDSNALQPLLSSIPPLNEPPTQGSLAQKWEAEARKLQLHQSFLTTGAPSGSTCMQSIMRKVRPDDPLNVVRAGAETIEREASIVPTCFDPWWRAMTLALCVKVMTVFSECSPTHSNSFDQWCQQKVDHTRKEHRLLYDLFIQNKGKKVEQKDVVAAEGSKKRKVTTGTLNAFGSVGPSLTALPKRKKRRAKSKRK